MPWRERGHIYFWCFASSSLQFLVFFVLFCLHFHNSINECNQFHFLLIKLAEKSTHISINRFSLMSFAINWIRNSIYPLVYQTEGVIIVVRTCLLSYAKQLHIAHLLLVTVKCIVHITEEWQIRTVINQNGILAILSRPQWVNPLRPRQNRHLIADDVFKCNFLIENVRIPIKISPKFVPHGPINNVLALVRIMAWCRTGDKPLSEAMMTQFNDAYMRHSASMS